MKTPEYIRCPRCELNYIHKKDKFCEVCKKEMQVGGGADFVDLDLDLCPICKTNYIQPDEIMCASCLAERNASGDIDDNNDWEDYIQRDEQEIDDANEEVGDMSSIKSYDDDDLLDSDLAMQDDEDDLDFAEDVDDDSEDDDESDSGEDDEFDDIDIDDYDEEDNEEDEDDDE